MADLEVVAVITAKPGSEAVVRGALRELVSETVKEPGCVAYRLFESGAAAGTFITVETWKSQADLDGHMQSPHIARTFEVAGDHLAEAPTIHPLVPVH